MDDVIKSLFAVFVIFAVIGSVSQSSYETYAHVDQEGPYKIEVMRFDPSEGVIEFRASISANKSAAVDGQMHIKNKNSDTLRIQDFSIDGINRVRNQDFNKDQQFIEVKDRGDLTPGKSYNATLKYDPRSRDRFSFIWGSTSSEVTVIEATSTLMSNGLVEVNISAQGAPRTFVDDEGDNWITNAGINTLGNGLHNIKNTSASPIFRFCSRDDVSCGGSSISNPNTTVIMNTPVTAKVQYTIVDDGRNCNITYTMRSGSAYFDSDYHCSDQAVRIDYINAQDFDGDAQDQIILSEDSQRTLGGAGWNTKATDKRWLTLWDEANDISYIAAGSPAHISGDRIGFYGGDNNDAQANLVGCNGVCTDTGLSPDVPFASRHGLVHNGSTGHSDLGYSFWSVFNVTQTITDSGECQYHKGDVVQCAPTDDEVTSTVIFSENVTRGYFEVGPFNDSGVTQFYFYGSDSSITTSDLLLCLINASGVWSYSDTCDGETPSIFATNTSIDSGTFNDTGVHDNGDGTFQVIVGLDSPFENYFIKASSDETGFEPPPAAPTGGLTGQAANFVIVAIFGMAIAGIAFIFSVIARKEDLGPREILEAGGVLIIILTLITVGIALI